jgi:hypothetical protein
LPDAGNDFLLIPYPDSRRIDRWLAGIMLVIKKIFESLGSAKVDRPFARIAIATGDA